jgi:hypothetical protein
MKKSFLKKGNVVTINGGYVVNKETSEPVFNEAFIAAQKEAEYVITFAAMAKGKDFKGKEAVNLAAFRQEVSNELNKKTVRTFIEAPKAPVMELQAKLKAEAMAQVNFDIKSDEVNQINAFLDKFSIIAEFEEFGLYFTEPNEAVKLKNIYTMKDITKAVTSCEELMLD